MVRQVSWQWRRFFSPLVVVLTAAAVFVLLLVAVRTQWAPLEDADHGAADGLNNLVAGEPAAVAAIKAVTFLGSGGVLWTVIGLTAAGLALRRRWALAAYLLITGAGALVLDPVLKALVGRVRPVVPHPVAHGTGNSFPSGHSLGSLVCYGAVFLVFLPAARGRWRTWFTAVAVTLIAVIGISRLLLGVHFVSDVLGAWAVGVLWLALTAFAFEATRQAAGQRITDPASEGLEPEARADLRPAGTGADGGSPRRQAARVGAGVLTAWVLIVGLITGLGELITKYGNGNVLGDRTVPAWFAAHRTTGLTPWSQLASHVAAAELILLAALIGATVLLAVTRSWRPVIFLAVVLAGELAAFLTVAAVVKRPRPPVSHLDPGLPTSAFPSGHEAAACCLYIGLAILVIGLFRGWWRWLILIPAVAMPVLVALSRMYRGEHHPTDIAGSLLFAGLWLTAATLLIRPLRIRPAARPAPAAAARTPEPGPPPAAHTPAPTRDGP